MTKHWILAIVILIQSVAVSLSAQEMIPAFPGAEGYGAYVTGGRGGDVYVVTNLNDAGPGSLREAVEAIGPRTIVFAVSGTIELQDRLRISNGDLTIAGQTAPGDGICVKNYSFTFSADNIIVRYISMRLGVDKRWENDAVNGSGNNIIMDHCTVSWGIDETLSLYSSSNLTVQWCMITEGLTFISNSYGGIWGGQPASFHHNLFAHQSSRTPRLCGSRYHGDTEAERVDLTNNVIYNWSNNSCYGGEGGSFNIVNNYYKSGPATLSSVRRRIVAPRPDDGTDEQQEQEAGVWGRFYVDGNYVEGFPDVTADNSLGIDEVPAEMWSEVISEVPFETEPIAMQTPAEAYMDVLQHAGASLPKRDRVDARITEEVRTGTAKYGSSTYPGIINHPDDVGGYPELVPAPPPLDTDLDGMTDAWEDSNGLNKNDQEDGKLIRADGYSNLEHYLNSLVGDFRNMLRPMEVHSTVNDKTVELAWTDLSDNEEGFILERAEGDGAFTQIADLDADTESFTDQTITTYGIHTYRLKAYDATMETCFTDGLDVDVADPNPPWYALTVDVDGSGNVIMNPSGGTYLTGTEVVLLATADQGWEFDSWGGDLSGSDNPLVINVDSDKNILAVFNHLTNARDELTGKSGIRIYPMPLSERTRLEIQLETETTLGVRLYDLGGRIMTSIDEQMMSPGTHLLPIDWTGLPGGSYILKVVSDLYGEEQVIISK